MKGNQRQDPSNNPGRDSADDPSFRDRQSHHNDDRPAKPATDELGQGDEAGDVPDEQPGSGLGAADTASGDVTAAGGPRFDHDLSDHPPAKREEALD